MVEGEMKLSGHGHAGGMCGYVAPYKIPFCVTALVIAYYSVTYSNSTQWIIAKVLFYDASERKLIAGDKRRKSTFCHTICEREKKKFLIAITWMNLNLDGNSSFMLTPDTAAAVAECRKKDEKCHKIIIKIALICDESLKHYDIDLALDST